MENDKIQGINYLKDILEQHTAIYENTPSSCNNCKAFFICNEISKHFDDVMICDLIQKNVISTKFYLNNLLKEGSKDEK